MLTFKNKIKYKRVPYYHHATYYYIEKLPGILDDHKGPADRDGGRI